MKKIIAFSLACCMIFGTLLTGCNNKSEKSAASSNLLTSGSKISENKVTLNIVAQVDPLAEDYNKMQFFKDLEEKTNVHINWNCIPASDYTEKKNLLLASGNVPDAFYNAGFTDSDVNKYSKDGTIISLDTLVDQYMPNVKKLYQNDAGLKQFMTSPDGHIYSLPVGEEFGAGQNGIGSNPYFYFINKKWLDKLGLKVPTTLDELQAALTAFKNDDPNGNGKHDEMPMAYINNWWCADIGNFFGSFGMPDNGDHLIVRNNKVIYTGVTDQFKNAVSYFHKWASQGLIDPASFTQTKDSNHLFAMGQSKDEVLGSFVWWEADEVVGSNRVGDYVLCGPLAGPDGTKDVGYANGSNWGRGAFVITKSNKNPEITARWIDALYDAYMAAQVHWGPIGTIFEKGSDGKLSFKELPAGTEMGQVRQKVAPTGVGVITANMFSTIVPMEERAKVRIDRIKKFVPDMEKQNLPTLSYTQDEIDRMGTMQTDLQTLTNKMRAQWLMNGITDDSFNQYKAQLQSIGLEKYLNIVQTAYDRYSKQK